MYLGKPDINSYEKGADREYFISNGNKNYSFNTIIGANTRKNHGLYVSFDNVKSKLLVHVAKIEEIINIDGKKYNLSTNKYLNSVFPEGYRYLQEFYTNPFPVFLYVIHSVMIKKTILMPPDSDVLLVNYEIISSPNAIEIEIRPLMAHREVDLKIASSQDRNFQVFQIHDNLMISSDMTSTFLNITSGVWSGSNKTYENIIYDKDELEGDSFVDKYWSAGYFSIKATEGKAFSFIVSKNEINLDFDSIRKIENKTRLSVNKSSYNLRGKTLNDLTRDLMSSASCLIHKENGIYSIISGYPSFQENSFNTFMSLPGLLLSSDKIEIADKIFDKWIGLSKANNGVVPLSVDEKSHASPSGDAGLVLVYSLGKYVDKVGSIDKIKLNWNEIKSFMDNYFEENDRIGLTQDDSGLLRLIDNNYRSDWMNSKINNQYIVNRKGYLIESNAFFYNALKTMEMFSLELDDKSSALFYSNNAKQVASSLLDVFWNVDGAFLCDWVDGGYQEKTIRPNQIFAISLPYTALSPDKGVAVLQNCWNHLYTTFGLRSLDPRDDHFKGRFEGRSDQRLKARYRGMAWPWLLGQFISAFMRYYPKRPDIALTFTRPFVSHLSRGCLGGVAEFFDGTMPYNPHGDFLSALSVGELLRVLDEDLLEFDRL
ncbi:glycogen debranching enzyme N-terminal domain-containing protein [Aminithiophilus ramosus]|uniref:Glycogen debranching enzyme N-terminal domain-containing protein n=1 Tax=Aminithiophilus ramosus TaxID=3029084 RepID=A0A9Q7EYI8_9BACT|nr:amylo-alpha-1,6-glucosidase [Aminithiophilus ramosus]QTX33550.1 glycogen debranching enzyme N-terminal domain-containing protein [Aminithiophilus ramosus]